MTAQEAQWLNQIIAAEELHVLFQPIVDANQQAIYGYEALIRGPKTSPLHSPLRLFDVATQAGLLVELDLLCRRLAIRRFAELELPGLLFLNVMPLTIVERDFREGLTLSFIQESGLPPERVVIELTEHVPIHDYELMRQAVDHYRDMGFLPEALVNYMGLMGWSMPDEAQIFSLDAMIKAFDVDRISTGGPIFDQQKLSWLNGQYLRQLAPQEYADKISTWLVNESRLAQLIPLVQERAERLSDLLPLVDYLLGNRRGLAAKDFEHKSLQRDQVVAVLHHTLAAMDEMRTWQRDELFAICNGLAAATELKVRDYLFPIFVAIKPDLFILNFYIHFYPC